MNQRWMRRVQVGGFVLGSVIVLAAADTASLPSPPVAKKVPHISDVNGHKMVDNYFWLRVLNALSSNRSSSSSYTNASASADPAVRRYSRYCRFETASSCV